VSRFLVDNQLPAALTRWLRDKGQEAEHVLDLNLGQSPDTQIWQRAAELGAVIVTKDEDFAQLTILRPETVAGGKLPHLRLAGKFRAPLARNSPTVKNGCATDRGLLILITLLDY